MRPIYYLPHTPSPNRRFLQSDNQRQYLKFLFEQAALKMLKEAQKKKGRQQNIHQ